MAHSCHVAWSLRTPEWQSPNGLLGWPSASAVPPSPMPAYRARPGFFEVPHAAVYVLMTLTVLASGFCFIEAGGPAAPADLLFRYGAMYAAALARHDYWRL